MNIRDMCTIDRERQQMTLRHRIDMACIEISDAWIADGNNPDELIGLVVYVGPMSLAIDGGSENARWALAQRLHAMGITGDF